jgi:hypothetical protein
MAANVAIVVAAICNSPGFRLSQPNSLDQRLKARILT